MWSGGHLPGAHAAPAEDLRLGAVGAATAIGGAALLQHLAFPSGSRRGSIGSPILWIPFGLLLSLLCMAAGITIHGNPLLLPRSPPASPGSSSSTPTEPSWLAAEVDVISQRLIVHGGGTAEITAGIRYLGGVDAV